MATKPHTTTRQLPVQIVAMVLGAAFVLIGIAGFIPGITAHYDRLAFGASSMATLFGVFMVSVLHNIVHLVFGVVGLALARTIGGARGYLLWGGAAYFALWIYGAVVLATKSDAANFVPFDKADNWLHLGLGFGMVALGIFTPSTERGATGRM